MVYKRPKQIIVNYHKPESYITNSVIINFIWQVWFDFYIKR